MDQPSEFEPRRKRVRRWARRGLTAQASLLGVYLALAYMLLPAWWRHHLHHPALSEAPKTAQTSIGIPGDPLNVGLIGSKEQVVDALLAAGWDPADPITLKTSLRISKSVLLRKSYPEAPVSNLYVWGRRQDLAFERAVGGSPQQRHHVRFWRSEERDGAGRLLWIGAATFDRSVGLSHYTGQITHHIAADVDGERDLLMDDLRRAGVLAEVDRISGVGFTLRGRNGGGDLYRTDGFIAMGILASP